MNKMEKVEEKFIGLTGFLNIGKYIIFLFGGFIVIREMVDFYINFESALKASPEFTMPFMFAIASVPIFISYYMLRNEIFKD